MTEDLVAELTGERAVGAAMFDDETVIESDAGHSWSPVDASEREPWG